MEQFMERVMNLFLEVISELSEEEIADDFALKECLQRIENLFLLGCELDF